jgi:hypothetical protein
MSFRAEEKIAITIRRVLRTLEANFTSLRLARGALAAKVLLLHLAEWQIEATLGSGPPF